MKIKKLILNYFDSQSIRDLFIKKELSKLPDGTVLLDAGCGSQPYKQYCKHLKYMTQDFGQFNKDELIGFADGAGGSSGYKYGEIDYLGEIWRIDEKDGYFDVILCTEVFEHIPYPVETINEFSRLLKKDGTLILTAPSNCLRHMDPFFFYTGFTNRWYEKVLSDSNFKIEKIEQVGDYYKWMAVEIGRAAHHHNILAKILLLPAFLYFFFKKSNSKSKNTLCLGYHVVAKRI